MKKFWIQFVTLVVVILLSIYLTYDSNAITQFIPEKGQGSVPQPSSASSPVVKINDTQVNVEIADTQDLRSKGLGGRDSLDANSGMLFVFPETKQYQFWMKGMKFPLDFIWINNGKVVDLLRNIPAPVAGQQDQNLPIYQPVVPVNQVLEVNAGFVDNHGIKVGDSVQVIQ